MDELETQNCLLLKLLKRKLFVEWIFEYRTGNEELNGRFLQVAEQ